MSTTASGLQITSYHSRHGHPFEVVVRFCGEEITVDLETGFARSAGGRVHSPANAETLAELREQTGWREPITYVEHVDPATGEVTITSEPCYFCEQLKRVEW